MSRRRSVRFRLAATAFLLVLVAALAEFAAWSVGAEIPGWRLVDAEGVILTGHPTRLWGLSPGPKQNGNATALINDLGMRGPMPELPKPAGRLRVLVVGDSTWFGHGVSDAETFPARLEARLKGRGLDVDVLNGGVPGYSTEQSRLFLEEQGWSLEPDLLVVGNLWSDNNIDSFRDQDLLATARAARENPLFRSHFFRLLAGAVDRARGGSGARIVTWTKESQHPEMGGRRVALPRYGENLDWMAREAAARGVGVAFVGPCNLGMVNGKFPEGASWAVFFDAQAKVAAHHGVPWIPTLDAMRAAGGADPAALFVDVMHPSPAGHAVFAAAVDEGLAAAGWPGDRLLAEGGPYPWETLVDSGFGYGHTNPSSPQRNLFGDVRVAGPPPAEDPRAKHTDNPGGNEGPAGAGNPAGNGGSPGGGSPGGSVGGGNGAPGAAVGLPKWSVAGTVAGAAPPFVVQARGNGATVASARLAAAGAFALNVRGDLDAVEIVVTDAAGAAARKTVARGQAAGTLEPR